MSEPTPKPCTASCTAAPVHLVGGASTAPAVVHRPTLWQRIAVRGNLKNSPDRLGTITSVEPMGALAFWALMDDEQQECGFLSNSPSARLLLEQPYGMLPLWLLQRNADSDHKQSVVHLQPVTYDLVLKSTLEVTNCFFKRDRFLEIAGAHRHIALADVACLRPSV